MLNTYSAQVYSELWEFLEVLGNDYINKIPKKLLKIFEDNKSANYIPHINTNIPIKEQSLNKETLTLIAILNLKYWCKDKDEIKRLKTVYINNEKLYQKKIKQNADINNIFKNRKNIMKNVNTTEMIKFELPLYKKILIKIKNKMGKL